MTLTRSGVPRAGFTNLLPKARENTLRAQANQAASDMAVLATAGEGIRVGPLIEQRSRD